MQKTALVPYAHLPRAHHAHHVLTSTVDVFGTAHWLLADRAPQPGGDALPFDALVVSVHPGGEVELTELSAVRARWPHLDRLPDGGFVVAASRARRYEDADQVQVLNALGREASSFSVGDAIEHLLVDEAGHIWVGHFDENPVGYADFPLVEIRPDRPVRVWPNQVRGAKAVAIHGERVAFYGGYAEEVDRLTRGELTEASVEPTDGGLLTLPDGHLPGRRRAVSRGSRIYVQAEPFTAWGVVDLSS
ncbi:hypothetical protein ACFC3O_24150 [Streptomyces sp. NPDC056007]|uniref:hypothetical protein n=1 Tax=Streptomyces sp. NPDC056007 TaxID=3345678 RepID=UPI0035DD88FA